MLTYISTEDYFIRESEGLGSSLTSRMGIPKELGLEIFKYCKSLSKSALEGTQYSQLKESLNIPLYGGLELFQDIKKGLIDLQKQKIIVKNG